MSHIDLTRLAAPARVDSDLRSEKDISLEQDENELSEKQLRELYDNEEIDRFLRIFSDYVSEVQVPQSPEPLAPSGSASHPKDEGDYMSMHCTSEESEWIVPDSNSPPNTGPVSSNPTIYNSLSEQIAFKYVIPNLPMPKPSTPGFTIGQLRLATQRLYLATLPVYIPFFRTLKGLATWEDTKTSSIYCCLFWILWWNNLLTSALVLRILYSLVKRRIFPYPSLSELRRHREAIGRADDFGEQISARISAKGSNLTEVWRLLRLVDLKKIRKTKTNKKRGKQPSLNDNSRDSDHESITSQDQDATVLDKGSDEDDDIKDIKQDGLIILQELADLHERVQNIFIWRKPSASRTYGIILFFVLLLVLFLPAKYIAKLTFFILGVIFWHIIPVIAALPPSEAKRLPPPLFDVPTDAQYAMYIISQRIAAGLDVRPKRVPRRKKVDNTSSVNLTSAPSEEPPSTETDRSVNWEKWGGRFATGMSVVNDIKRLKPGGTASVWPPSHPLIPGSVGIAQPHLRVETHTYPCQHSSSPGLITLTQSSMFFTPLMSQKAKLIIPLKAVKGIKKSGLLRGLNVRWVDTRDGKKDTKEDNFLWVGGRDELFARLVGTDSTRWATI